MKKRNVSKKEIVALILCVAWTIIVLSCFVWLQELIIDPVHPAESGFIPYMITMFIVGTGCFKIFDVFGINSINNRIENNKINAISSS